MSCVRFLGIGLVEAKDGIVAIELEDDWRLAVFHTPDQCMTILREASLSSEELGYWEPQLAECCLPRNSAQPPVTVSGTAASMVGVLLAQLDGEIIPAPNAEPGQPNTLAIFRVPVKESPVRDGMMGVRGEKETFQVFYSRMQAIQLLASHRSWLGEEQYGRCQAELDASPLPALSDKKVVTFTSYSAWLMNEVMERYEKVRLAQERRRRSAN